MKQIYTFKKTVKEILDEFKRLPAMKKEQLRVSAMKRMKAMGWEETGTRDLEIAVVDIYREFGSFEAFFEKELEFQHEGYYSEL